MVMEQIFTLQDDLSEEWCFVGVVAESHFRYGPPLICIDHSHVSGWQSHYVSSALALSVWTVLVGLDDILSHVE